MNTSTQIGEGVETLLARITKHFKEKLEFTISPVTLRKTLASGEPLQVIDLRSKEYFVQGHIPGAVNWELSELENHLGELSQEILTIVCCYDLVCNLGAKAAIVLATNGFPVKELEGGYEEWEQHLSFDKHKPPQR
ncbi:MAG: rhodanese-like domain-containing protein [Candidatus Melainabacteria bacterium]|nr:rhodanese-like domain-containing protein [Candidatus Melainabacteria bacterium]